MKIFISGSISIKKLSKNAIECLEQVIKENRTVLIGDANGADRAVQQYLFEQKYQNIIVYFSGEKIRNNIGSWQTKQISNPENLTGRDRYQLKDKAMAEDCNDGMMVWDCFCNHGMMFWDCKSKGTKDNIEYMEKLKNKYSIVLSDSVDEICYFAFKSCTCLASVFISSSVTRISKDAFKGCRAIITVDPDNPVYTIRNGKLALKEVKAEGRVGNLEWKLANRVLTIKANGKISDYDDYSKGWNKGASSWYPYREVIKKIVFKGNHPYIDRCDISSVTFENWTVPSDNDTIQVQSIIERAFKGYISDDLWNIDHWFCEQMPRMLRDFKRDSYGYASGGGLPMKEWRAILDRMIFCFSKMYKQHNDCWDDKTNTDLKEIKKEAFDLFFKYFEELSW